MMPILSKLQFLAAQAADFATSNEGHHATPTGPYEYVISAVGAVIVAVVIWYAVVWFIRPKESEADHIKRRILDLEDRS